MSPNDTYQSPLNSRYASTEMKALWSPRTRFSTWRQLWVWLLEAQAELGLFDIPAEHLDKLRAHITIDDAEFAGIAEEERRRRHDVMAHVWGFGQKCPELAGHLHTGATSCYVTDNADLIFLRNGLDILLPKLAGVVEKLASSRARCKLRKSINKSWIHKHALLPTVVNCAG